MLDHSEGIFNGENNVTPASSCSPAWCHVTQTSSAMCCSPFEPVVCPFSYFLFFARLLFLLEKRVQSALRCIFCSFLVTSHSGGSVEASARFTHTVKSEEYVCVLLLFVCLVSHRHAACGDAVEDP